MKTLMLPDGTIEEIKFTWIDPMYCPICECVTMFRYTDTPKKHICLLECTGSWDKSVSGCGFKFVFDATPYDNAALERNDVNKDAAKHLYINVFGAFRKGILLPISIIGDSMYPTFEDGKTYVMEVTDELIDGRICNIILYGNKPNCCRVARHGNRYWLYKDNELFAGGNGLYVSEKDFQLCGVFLDYRKKNGKR